jgi:hypothetical protein
MQSHRVRRNVSHAVRKEPLSGTPKWQRQTNLEALCVSHPQNRLWHLTFHGFLHAAPSQGLQSLGAKGGQQLIGPAKPARPSFNISILFVLLFFVPPTKRHD